MSTWLEKLKPRVEGDKPVLKSDLQKLIKVAEIAEIHVRALFPYKGKTKDFKMYMDNIGVTANDLRKVLEIDNVKGTNNETTTPSNE